MSATRPAGLDGIRVLDLTQGVSGPFCTRLLAQMGARVIKVEKPVSGDIIRAWDDYVNGMCTGHAWVNPGKESLALDLKTQEGQAILLQLVESSDVLIENFVPGTLEAWGLSEERIRQRKRDIIFCRISGFGQDGPDSDRTALDLIVQGETGLLSTNGSKEQAAKISVSIADLSGSMYATIAILESLYHRERTGEGQVIDLALFDAVMTWSGYFPYLWWYQGREPGRVGLDHHTMYPYGPFGTRDGKTVIVAAGAGSRVQWAKFCAAIDRSELVDMPNFASNEKRIANKAELGELISAAIGARDLDHWLRAFQEAGIPAGPLNQFRDGMEHRRMVHRNFVVEVDSAVGPVKAFDFPPQISGLRSVNKIGPPQLGEHTQGILAELGMTPAEVDRLVQAGTVQVASPQG